MVRHSPKRRIAKRNVSGAITPKFPDVCKTPSPGGPIPIPYPKIGRSSDSARGSKKVKTNGSRVMPKDRNFGKSSGDESDTSKKKLRRLRRYKSRT